MAQLGGIGTGVALGSLVGAAVGDGLGVLAAVGSGVLGCSGTLTSGVSLGCALGTGHVEPPTNGVDDAVGLSDALDALAGAVPIGDEIAADGEQALNAAMSSRTRKRLGWRMRPHDNGLAVPLWATVRAVDAADRIIATGPDP